MHSLSCDKSYVNLYLKKVYDNNNKIMYTKYTYIVSWTKQKNSGKS